MTGLPSDVVQDPGFEFCEFRSLSNRLIPCGPGYILWAIDLRHQPHWWDVDKGQWRRTTPEDAQFRYGQVQAWRAVAPKALDAWTTVLQARSNDEARLAFTRFVAIEETLIETSGLHCAWQSGWLYRSLLLDHRWLLPGATTEPFCDETFKSLVLASWNDPHDEERLVWLRRDPVIAAMPSFHTMVYPESWKTAVLQILQAKGIAASIGEVNQALRTLQGSGRFSKGQASVLERHRGPLYDAAGEATRNDVAAAIASARLDAGLAETAKPPPFQIPSFDLALQVAPPRPVDVTRARLGERFPIMHP